MGSAVDEYLARLPNEQRETLEQVRRAIRSVAPGVEEVIRSGVPAFRYNGKPLVSIGAAKQHVALYVMYGAVLVTYKDELRAFDTSTTVIRFMPQAASHTSSWQAGESSHGPKSKASARKGAPCAHRPTRNGDLLVRRMR
jgi:uncharacterized protein YdhG (YjbR/CyaY superfamily)